MSNEENNRLFTSKTNLKYTLRSLKLITLFTLLFPFAPLVSAGPSSCDPTPVPTCPADTPPTCSRDFPDCCPMCNCPELCSDGYKPTGEEYEGQPIEERCEAQRCEDIDSDEDRGQPCRECGSESCCSSGQVFDPVRCTCVCPNEACSDGKGSDGEPNDGGLCNGIPEGCSESCRARCPFVGPPACAKNGKSWDSESCSCVSCPSCTYFDPSSSSYGSSAYGRDEPLPPGCRAKQCNSFKSLDWDSCGCECPENLAPCESGHERSEIDCVCYCPQTKPKSAGAPSCPAGPCGALSLHSKSCSCKDNNGISQAAPGCEKGSLNSETCECIEYPEAKCTPPAVFDGVECECVKPTATPTSDPRTPTATPDPRTPTATPDPRTPTPGPGPTSTPGGREDDPRATSTPSPDPTGTGTPGATNTRDRGCPGDFGETCDQYNRETKPNGCCGDCLPDSVCGPDHFMGPTGGGGSPCECKCKYSSPSCTAPDTWDRQTCSCIPGPPDDGR